MPGVPSSSRTFLHVCTRMYSYVIGVYPYVLVCYSYVVVCYSYVLVWLKTILKTDFNSKLAVSKL